MIANLTDTPRIVAWMEATLAAVKESQAAGKFNMRNIWHPCGSPACIAGHGVIELHKLRIVSDPEVEVTMELCRRCLGFPLTKGDVRWCDEFGRWWFSGNLPEAEAIRRWELTLRYRQRQLRTLRAQQEEVAPGVYRQRKAADCPVGKELERIASGGTAV